MGIFFKDRFLSAAFLFLPASFYFSFADARVVESVSNLISALDYRRRVVYVGLLRLGSSRLDIDFA